MILDKRKLNERKFDEWEEKEAGERIYKKKIKGKLGWYAVYEKIVDKDEITISFTQYIFNEKGDLMELLKKYPEDSGHQIL